ncbi:Oidioi.mRNA.OKI2018_I69.chr2.g5712.t1.cds [Oikopleura dioica]|uniref:cyclic pyranopterin monophosphate synthase n=1 Tax=Oikopleura dioica TaxID=34765 RepID=A0ABN7TA89_OIKDI|nr:Oidioi.mRNA.OKI2018_I69.chr2.g5712.t1.cds [Oikopleura dioica]
MRRTVANLAAKKFSHINSAGKANMVSVTEKLPTVRTAVAFSSIKVSDECYQMIVDNQLSKGDVLSVARIAGIQGAKKTSELIPLCHNIPIDKVDISFDFDEENCSILVECFAKTFGKTGIEMEALTGASVASLTIYDMVKAVDKTAVIQQTKLKSKTGGKSGDFNSSE